MADSPTNPDQTANNTFDKYVNATVEGYNNLGNLLQQNRDKLMSGISNLTSKLPFGAQPQKLVPAAVNIRNINGNLEKKDLRARIEVPQEYISSLTTVGYASAQSWSDPNGALKDMKGILFPYTPQINYDTKADYTSSSPLHSNYAVYFYQRSSIGAISITGKFTVQNDEDAINYLSTVNLLRALTKMKFGDEADHGAPPPVCRLYAYGTYVLENVPIVITSFRIDLTDAVDYYTLGKDTPHIMFGSSSVPVSTSISVTCQPIYSRQEMQKFTVYDLLNSKPFKEQGYL